MGYYNNPVTTTAGLELLNKHLVGNANIKFVSMVIGSGTYEIAEKTTEALLECVALKNIKKTIPFSNKEVVYGEDGDLVKLSALVTNEDVTESFYITEIGIMAQDISNDDSDPILFSISIANMADPLPKYNGKTVNQIIEEYCIKVSNAYGMTIKIGQGAAALADDLVAEKIERKKEIAIERARIDALLGGSGDGAAYERYDFDISGLDTVSTGLTPKFYILTNGLDCLLCIDNFRMNFEDYTESLPGIYKNILAIPENFLPLTTVQFKFVDTDSSELTITLSDDGITFYGWGTVAVSNSKSLYPRKNISIPEINDARIDDEGKEHHSLGNAIRSIASKKMPLEFYDGIVVNGEFVSLIVGEDVQVGQVIEFTWLGADGYEWITVDSTGFVTTNTMQPTGAEILSETITIEEGYTEYRFIGAYFELPKTSKIEIGEIAETDVIPFGNEDGTKLTTVKALKKIVTKDLKEQAATQEENTSALKEKVSQLEEQIAAWSQINMIDESTGKTYKLSVIEGKLTMKEVAS